MFIILLQQMLTMLSLIIFGFILIKRKVLDAD